MNRLYRPYSRPFSEDDIADQFEGMEIEFNDKATLFPVQVEKEERPRRRMANELRARSNAATLQRSDAARLARRRTAVKPLRRI